MSTVNSMVTVVDFVKELLENADLGLQDVFYGDQDFIPRFPAAVVEPNSLVEAPTTAGFSKENHFQVMVMIFHSQLGSSEVTKRECDLAAEAVKDVLNADRQLGGLVTWGYVSSTDYGYAMRGKQTIQATRMLYEAISKGPM